MAETLSFASSSISDSMRVTASRNCACGAHHEVASKRNRGRTERPQHRENNAHFLANNQIPGFWLHKNEGCETRGTLIVNQVCSLLIYSCCSSATKRETVAHLILFPVDLGQL